MAPNLECWFYYWQASRFALTSIPIALGELISITLLFPARGDPNGIGVRWQLPVTGHPFITIVAPRPVACKPDVLGRRLRQHDFRLGRRRRCGHNGGADGGRGRGNQHIGGVAEEHEWHWVRAG